MRGWINWEKSNKMRVGRGYFCVENVWVKRVEETYPSCLSLADAAGSSPSPHIFRPVVVVPAQSVTILASSSASSAFAASAAAMSSLYPEMRFSWEIKSVDALFCNGMTRVGDLSREAILQVGRRTMKTHCTHTFHSRNFSNLRRLIHKYHSETASAWRARATTYKQQLQVQVQNKQTRTDS